MTSFFDEKLQFYKVEYSKKKTISRLFITPPPPVSRQKGGSVANVSPSVRQLTYASERSRNRTASLRSV